MERPWDLSTGVGATLWAGPSTPVFDLRTFHGEIDHASMATQRNKGGYESRSKGRQVDPLQRRSTVGQEPDKGPQEALNEIKEQRIRASSGSI